MDTTTPQASEAPAPAPGDVLRQQQHVAILLLAAGHTIKDAAEEAGVGRTTIYRWINSDPAFRAAYNEWREQTRLSVQGQLMGIAESAADAVRQAIDGGDAATAVKVLQGLGLLAPPRRGATIVEDAEREIVVESLEDLARYEMRRGKAMRRRTLASIASLTSRTSPQPPVEDAPLDKPEVAP